jgi:hypothetical protein
MDGWAGGGSVEFDGCIEEWRKSGSKEVMV